MPVHLKREANPEKLLRSRLSFSSVTDPSCDSLLLCRRERGKRPNGSTDMARGSSYKNTKSVPCLPYVTQPENDRAMSELVVCSPPLARSMIEAWLSQFCIKPTFPCRGKEPIGPSASDQSICTT
jgi:hypothetical protein